MGQFRLGRRAFAAFCGLVELEAETDLTALGSGTGFALGLLSRSLVGAEAAHFFEDTFGFKFRLETFKGAIYRFAFFDLDFGHERQLGLELKGENGLGEYALVRSGQTK